MKKTSDMRTSRSTVLFREIRLSCRVKEKREILGGMFDQFKVLLCALVIESHHDGQPKR